MVYIFKKYLLHILLLVLIFSCSTLNADVYGGGNWETIGIGNLPCKEFNSNAQNSDHKEIASMWVSGYLTGINFTSQDVYDISNAEDIYMLTRSLIINCEAYPDKTLSEIATEMVYKRYQGKNYIPAKNKENK